MEPNLVLKEVRSLRKSLRRNAIKWVVPAGQESTQEIFQLVKRECVRNLLLKQNKAYSTKETINSQI